MKIKELGYLANLSIKSSKKSNKIIILLLSVSMIIIIPVFVFWISVNVTINNKLNAIPYMLFSQAEMKDYRTNTASDEKTLSGSEYISVFDNIQSKIVYEKYYLTNEFPLADITFSIDNKQYNLENDKFRYYNIIDIEKSSYFFPQNFKSYGSIFVENCGKSFTEKGKKQVILSEKLLETLGMTTNEVYGKNMSIFMSNEFQEGYLCYEYEVAGIIKKELTQIFEEDIDSFMNAQLFFCSSNVYNDEGEGVLKPIMTNNDYEFVYKNIDNKDDLNKEYMMLGLDGRADAKDYFNLTKIFIEGEDYHDLARINSYLFQNSITPQNSSMYENYKTLYNASNIVTFIFATAGIVLILITILYYYLNIKHNVNKRQNFLTIMRAIGAHDSDIPKIYMMQSNILCGKASLIFAVFGFILCALIKLVIENILALRGLSGIVSIPWASIIFSVIGMIAFMFAITNLIAILCVVKMSKQPIMEILHKEQ